MNNLITPVNTYFFFFDIAHQKRQGNHEQINKNIHLVPLAMVIIHHPLIPYITLISHNVQLYMP